MKIVKSSVHLIDSMGSDLSVVNAARVSFAKESDWEYEGLERFRSQYDEKKLSEKDQKLINYLAKHSHWSPFAHNSLTFRVKAPIFVARQLVKHQVGGVWNEVSRRYVDEEPEFYMPKRGMWRGKAENVKQGSSSTVFIDAFEYGHDYTEDIPADAVEVCLEAYTRMLKKGIAPEQARMILPQNTMTEWWWSGTLGAFLDMLVLRLDSHTQYETRLVAEKISVEIQKLFPVSYAARINL